jgi:hypothetical protein
MGELEQATAHALMAASRGTKVGDWAHSAELEFEFTDPEDALGRVFYVLSAMRTQLIQIATEVDNLRDTIASAERIPNAPTELDESGQ